MIHGTHRGLRVAFIIGLGCVLAAPASAKQLPEVSHDGLHLVKKTSHGGIYLKPGANFSEYDRLVILDCFVAFKKRWREENPSGFRVTQRDMDQIKQHLASEFHAVFVKELQAKGGYPIVDKGASDVMILRPAIVNLDVQGPDTMDQVDVTTFSASAGQMTLYLELYDSVTNDILARIIDAEAAQGGDTIHWRNGVTNKAAADRILKRWADALRKRLDEAHEHAKP